MTPQGIKGTALTNSQRYAWQAWSDVYNGDIGIALTDTLGWDKFAKDFDRYFGNLFTGVRHDSGDPVEWGNKTHAKNVDIFSYVSDEDVVWIERKEAEVNPVFKQIIPYIVVRNSKKQYLCYPRHGTENRLHGMYSCGIGGHIDEIDAGESFRETVHKGLMRELSEEIQNFSSAGFNLSYKGIINEIENAVGLVHLGLVYLAECVDSYVPIPAEELMGMEWKTQEEFTNIRKELWSELTFMLVT
jgi:predicted NUDIX family phosphoesterase